MLTDGVPAVKCQVSLEIRPIPSPLLVLHLLHYSLPLLLSLLSQSLLMSRVFREEHGIAVRFFHNHLFVIYTRLAKWLRVFVKFLHPFLRVFGSATW